MYTDPWCWIIKGFWFNHPSWLQEITKIFFRQLVQWKPLEFFTEFMFTEASYILSQERNSQAQSQFWYTHNLAKEGKKERFQDDSLSSRRIDIKTGKFSSVFPPSMLENVSSPSSQNHLVSRIFTNPQSIVMSFFHQPGFHTCSNLLPYTGSWYTTL